MGIGIAIVLSGVFLTLLGGFQPQAFSSQEDYLSNVGTGLFFAFTNAYAIVAGTFVTRRALVILADLTPHLTCDATERLEAQQWIAGGNRRYLTLVAVISTSAGVLHSIVLSDLSPGIVLGLFGDPADAAQTIGTIMSWVVISHLISQFISIAQTFARLGTHHLDIDLLRPEHLAPFSKIALLPALGLIGLQTMYPLLSLGGQFKAEAVVPGFLLGLGSLCYLLIAPNLGLRRNVIQAKRSAIATINQQIGQWQDTNSAVTNTPQALAALQSMLQHREYLHAVPEWPLSLASLLRWAFYVVIPPLTWAAAALMEIAIDQYVG